MSGKPTILITGATGSIGIPLVKKLIDEQFNLIVVVRNLEKSMQLFSDNVTHVIFDGHTFSEELSLLNPSIVIHLASYSTSKDDKEAIVTLVDSNILFVSLLLDALKNTPLKLFINAGSFSEFYTNNEVLNPTYLYSATKTASRFIIDYFSQTYNFTFVNAILYTVYGLHGENKKIVDFMMDSLEAKEPVKMSDGLQILDFVCIDDVIRFYLILIENYEHLSHHYHEYHIGTGKGSSIKELAQQFMRCSCKTANIQWGAIIPRKRDTRIAIADTQTVFDEIGWKATIDLETGIKMYLTRYESSHA